MYHFNKILISYHVILIQLLSININLVDKSIAWDDHWIDVYDLSEIIMKRTVQEFMQK